MTLNEELLLRLASDMRELLASKRLSRFNLCVVQRNRDFPEFSLLPNKYSNQVLGKFNLKEQRLYTQRDSCVPRVRRAALKNPKLAAFFAESGDVLSVEGAARQLGWGMVHTYKQVEWRAIPYFRVRDMLRFSSRALALWDDLGRPKELVEAMIVDPFGTNRGTKKRMGVMNNDQ